MDAIEQALQNTQSELMAELTEWNEELFDHIASQFGIPPQLLGEIRPTRSERMEAENRRNQSRNWLDSVWGG